LSNEQFSLPERRIIGAMAAKHLLPRVPPALSFAPRRGSPNPKVTLVAGNVPPLYQYRERAFMDVGIQMIFSSYGWDGMTDREAWEQEIRLARLADELGFDVIWSVEHHFFDYSFCPDNTQLLSYLAPLCTHADLGTAAIILPWNDPLRVAEKVSVLDLLSNGRVRLGLGRGLARREFAAFRGTMDESRERFAATCYDLIAATIPI
jgi:Luciferase-like monooxygenase